MTNRHSWARLALGMAVLILPSLLLTSDPPRGQASGAGSAILIKLKNVFIEKYKDRATIDATFVVDVAGKIHEPESDGDMHVSGRAKEVGLPVVAELMNAKLFPKAVTALQKAEGGDAIKVSGAWRIWCEHAGGATQEQGKELSKFDTSNPDHVFEIHPLTKVGDLAVHDSFRPIKGFTPKDAHAAFTHYENVRCKITPGTEVTTLRTSMAGYNIVKFQIESLEEAQGGKEIDDGRLMMCAVRDLQDELIVRKVRMVFVKGTKPEVKAKGLKKGDRLTVLGLPRLDLALVKFRVAHKDDEGEPLTWNLPYEMIILAAYEDE